METTTTTAPSVTGNTNDRIALLRMKQHRKTALTILTNISETQDRVAGIALLTMLGVKRDATLVNAIDLAINDREALGYSATLLETATKTVLTHAEAGNWTLLMDIVDGKLPAATEQPQQQEEEKPKKSKRAVTPAGRGIQPIELPKFDVPIITPPNPADPMGVFANALAPRWEAEAAKAKAEVVSKINPVIEELIKQINAQLNSGGSGVDEVAVKAIIHKSLSNGAGEEIKKLVSSNVPNVLSDVLDKAARAIAAQAMDQADQATLMAAFDPIPDPNYCWTPELTGMSDLLNQTRQIKPQNALVVGPTGAGKTEWAIQFAAKNGLKVMVMDCANVREARDWFGQKGASNGCTYFKKSQFWLAVEAGNCVIILDEFNRAPDHVRNPLMPLLDHRRQSFVEEVGETLKVGPGVVFIAALNEGLDYSGTHTTDKAMKSRFPRRIEVSYLPEASEIQVLLDKVPGLGKDDARKLVELANVIRSKANGFGGTLSETISTRQLIAAAEDFVIMGAPSFKHTIFAHFDASDGTNSERAQVIAAFEGKGYLMTAPKAKK